MFINLMQSNIFLALLVSLFFMSCSTTENTVNPDEIMSADKTEQSSNKTNISQWKERIENGELGQADFLKNELTTIDFWPYPLNKDEVFKKAISGNPYIFNTCANYIDNKDDQFVIKLQFLIDIQGSVHEITFLNEAGPCQKPFLESFKKIKFTPGNHDDVRLPTLIIYPVKLNYSYED